LIVALGQFINFVASSTTTTPIPKPLDHHRSIVNMASTDPLHKIGAITLFVDDLPASKTFYTDVFAAPVLFEDSDSCSFKLSNIIINLLKRGEADELITPKEVGPSSAGAQFMLSVFVEDMKSVLERLAAAKVELLNGPIHRPWGMTTAAFADPSGHCWEVAQSDKKQGS
jgi:catechol 2,3-dioxygenase-like lactoylglutathione lyase family enzyme